MFKGKMNGIDPEQSKKTKFKNDIWFRTNFNFE